MSLAALRHIYGEESKIYKDHVAKCEEKCAEMRKICDVWRDALQTEKVKAN